MGGSGKQAIRWSGRDSEGEVVASGLYNCCGNSFSFRWVHRALDCERGGVSMIQQAPGCNVAPFGLYLFLFITSGKFIGRYIRQCRQTNSASSVSSALILTFLIPLLPTDDIILLFLQGLS